MVTEEEGALAVTIAREAIQRTTGPSPSRDAAAPFRDRRLPAVFSEPRGVFVTIRRAASGALRGCIGFPLPVFPLGVALPRAAAAAAVEDPRFPPVTERELANLTVEVSVLTVPEEITAATPAGRLASVRVGRDGLIVDGDGTSGLLLPQVAVEEAWDARRFLAETCVKAGLSPESWTSPRLRFRRFQAEVFREERPGGAVRREPLESTG